MLDFTLISLQTYNSKKHQNLLIRIYNICQDYRKYLNIILDNRIAYTYTIFPSIDNIRIL